MKLKDQVCSLELAIKLKELGVKQDSLWFWEKEKFGYSIIPRYTILKRDCEYSAFTVAELGEMLPEEVKLPNEHRSSRLEFAQYRNSERWCVYYINELTEPKILFSAKTEADVRAKILGYLIKKGFLKWGELC